MKRRRGAVIALSQVLLFHGLIDAAEPPAPVYVRDGDLQAALDRAPAYATVVADRAATIEIASTVRIGKPLTLVGLNARMKPGVGKTPMLLVAAEDVRIRDFLLEGNAESVPQDERAPLIEVRRGRFVIENGEANHSSKDGVMITPVAETGDIEHGAIRNLTTRGTIRDSVSIGGGGDKKLFVRHLVVENIRGYGSRARGPVEVSDGSEYITVRDVYAESCAYGVDVQDHNRKGQVNRFVIIDGVHVKDTPIAIRTANHDFGHDGLTIRNVSGTDWPSRTRFPLEIKNTRNVLVENVRIHAAPGQFSMRVANSANVTLRNLSFTDCGHDGAALVLDDVDNALVDNVVVAGKAQPRVGVLYRIQSDRPFGGLRIHNVLAPEVRDAGIVIENSSKSGSLASYSITGNLATVRATVKAGRAIVGDNLPAASER